MIKLSTLALFALPAVLAIACGSSSSSTDGNGSVALNGTYAPVGDVTKAEFAKITFHDATTYSYVKANCTAACNFAGTYTFDGDTNLNLTDGVSHTTEHVDFKAVKVSGSNSTLAQSIHIQGLVTPVGSIVDAGGPIVMEGGSLLQQILQALMNGIMMALQNAGGSDGGGDDDSTGDDAGSSSGDDASTNACANPALLAACVALGGTFTSGSDGSCTCVAPDAGPQDAGVDAADAADAN